MYQRIQRGRGLGAFFGSVLKIFSKAAPLVKKVITNPSVKKIGKQALQSALSIGADALEDGNIKNSVQKEINKTKKQVSKVLRETSLKVESNRKQKKRKHNIKTSRPNLKKKKNISNLFD